MVGDFLRVLSYEVVKRAVTAKFIWRKSWGKWNGSKSLGSRRSLELGNFEQRNYFPVCRNPPALFAVPQ